MRLSCLITLMLLAGCSSYVTPGRGANMEAFGVSPSARANFTDGALRDNFAKKPLATFPTGVAIARVQSSGYESMTATSYGRGRYSVITTRDVETPEQIARLGKLPQVIGIAPVNRLLLPADLQSDLELRIAAAALHAEVLLIYTLDTTFNVDEKAAPLTVITLGLMPNKIARVNCTASAVMMDTRNGYIYGVAEATEKTDQLTTSWTSDEAVDESRRRAETKAFDKLVGEVETTWRGVVSQYARG